ncbi:MAG: ankyrin repeat protein [Paraglaciecola sp.]|jgi:ankyrin repeat protein
MVKYLVDLGADINFVSIKGKTALDYAIQYKHPEVTAYLKGLNAKQVKSLK